MIEDIEKFFKDRDNAIINKDFNTLYNCAMISAKEYPWDDNALLEASFFCGRANSREDFNKYTNPHFYSTFETFRSNSKTEERELFFDMGRRYPFLEDEELDLLESLYSESGTYKMISRMLFDADEMLRRKLARFNPSLFDISNASFSNKLCLEIFDALIRNEGELDIQNAMDERRWPGNSFPPIWVYNRRINSISKDTTKLTDVFLIPISNFSWAGIRMQDGIRAITEQFGEEIIETILYPALEDKGLNQHLISCAAFNSFWYLALEEAICNYYDISQSDSRLVQSRINIAKLWLKYQNEKPLQ